jgi:hypothetical protein
MAAGYDTGRASLLVKGVRISRLPAGQDPFGG